MSSSTASIVNAVSPIEDSFDNGPNSSITTNDSHGSEFADKMDKNLCVFVKHRCVRRRETRAMQKDPQSCFFNGSMPGHRKVGDKKRHLKLRFLPKLNGGGHSFAFSFFSSHRCPPLQPSNCKSFHQTSFVVER
jgi:hypothetical protein